MSTPSAPPLDLRQLAGLDDLREKLDELDRGVVRALAERDALVREVARRKADKGIGRVRDPVREAAMLTRLSAEAQAAGLDGFYVTRVFRELIDHSVRLQEELLSREQRESQSESAELVVAFQGVEGAYSHLAAQRYFGPRGVPLTFRGFTTFRAMMECVRDGQARYGVLPIENTTAGSINDAYDLLAQMDLAVVGEEIQKVEHCLVALDDVQLADVKRVFSHPQAPPSAPRSSPRSAAAAWKPSTTRPAPCSASPRSATARPPPSPAKMPRAATGSRSSAATSPTKKRTTRA